MPDWTRRLLVAIVWVAVLGAGLALAVRISRNPPAGPVEPAWDRAACADCRMLLGDPRFVSQLHTTDGEVLHFDDPGCLLAYQGRRELDVHEAWFHAGEGEVWLARNEVTFRRVDPAQTPMGYGLQATRRGAAPGLDYATALAELQVLASQRRRSAP